ncbi:hypothetical protein SAMN05421738_11190 [Algoriella xinjiangensis]|uniref:Uncharacterized protein n=1 Tax=Algoriella xinjiangensis TaxID=684065 RepID=A0A1I4YKH7_9FLAO|nr:hypothetical protein [Algoriella xinjiangensis]SFN38477.1 hypothetical protein SAMN05421738_11190 [Algoriella xinjiangensis]
MKTYIAEIIPKIQKFSQKLDNLSMLTNQHWVVLDELTQVKTVYIFRDNGELLIAVNGKVDKAKWEYLGNSSILIDLKENSYLFRHGFFDENILALKIDNKNEYAILINESKYQKELNSISAIIRFLSQNYIENPLIINKQGLGKQDIFITNIVFKRNGYTFKMGSYKEFSAKLSNGKFIDFYQKKSNEKYFIYNKNEIIIFPDKDTCVKFIEEKNL